MTETQTFKLGSMDLPDIKYHVFIPMQATKGLATLIQDENWGENNVLLYKYLDYVWRFQLIDGQIKLYTHKNEKRLLFHTGLYTKYSDEPVYLGLIPNKPGRKKGIQPWRVHFGYIQGKNISFRSFLTKDKLLKEHKLFESDIPNETNFFKDYRDGIFYPEYNFVINMDQHFINMKSRITKVILGDIKLKEDMNINCLFDVITKDSLCISIKKAITNARNNGNIVGVQAFVERDIRNGVKFTIGYHLELIIPFTLIFDNKAIYFAVVLRPNHKCKMYTIYAIISRQMAYCNSRLVAPVTLPWLKPFSTSNVITQNNHSNKHIISKRNNNNSLSIQEYKTYIAMMYFMSGNDFIMKT
mmetsp:Transcript_51232/g.62679  ORF Transcript_51232/g.62679 Transcript_51232/m.62679 type:complete len:356 (+) Transcript_51232:146-1213(+)